MLPSSKLNPSIQRVGNAVVPSVPYVVNSDGTVQVWTKEHGLTTAEGVKVIPSRRGKAAQIVPPTK